MATKPKPSKREAILDAMLDVVVERGPQSSHVARFGALGCPRRLIYHHFASKEEIKACCGLVY